MIPGVCFTMLHGGVQSRRKNSTMKQIKEGQNVEMAKAR